MQDAWIPHQKALGGMVIASNLATSELYSVRRVQFSSAELPSCRLTHVSWAAQPRASSSKPQRAEISIWTHCTSVRTSQR